MAEQDPLIGEVLAGDFQVTKLLGFGGYARVYLAEQVSVGRRPVAVKVIHGMHVDQTGQAAVAALKREATYLAMLRSPVFPRILRTGLTADGRPFFAMEYVAGRTLDAILKRQRALPVDRVLLILDAVCDGLSEMHGRDIVHRDLKTGNIAVEESPPGVWRVRLLDLGSAKPLTEGAAASTSTARWRPGSPPYLAPESVRDGVFTERSDLYSMAAVAYELLCGTRPVHIQEPTTEAYIEYLKSDRPIPTYRLGTLQPTVPEPLEDEIQKALSRDPAGRHPSVYEFREAIHRAMGRPVGTPGIAPGTAKQKASISDRLGSLFATVRDRIRRETGPDGS